MSVGIPKFKGFQQLIKLKIGEKLGWSGWWTMGREYIKELEKMREMRVAIIYDLLWQVYDDLGFRDVKELVEWIVENKGELMGFEGF